jgi:hypothetical protein
MLSAGNYLSTWDADAGTTHIAQSKNSVHCKYRIARGKIINQSFIWGIMRLFPIKWQ